MNEYKLILPKDYVRHELPGKAKWTKALRSGDFQQAKGKLFSPACNGYCCLGVLSKVQGRLCEETGQDGYEYEETEYSDVDLNSDNPLINFIGDIGQFPKGVKVEGVDRRYEIENVSDCLIYCNDNFELNFKQIADIIDKVWYDSEVENP